MNKSEAGNNRRRLGADILLLHLLLIVAVTAFFAVAQDHAYAEEPLIPDPESISMDTKKEGNVLYEYGFSVFTQESMDTTKKIKKNEEKKESRMLSGLFGGIYQHEAAIDMRVKKTIEDGELFASVDTGVETAKEEKQGDAKGFFGKYFASFAIAIFAAVFCVAVIRRNRKKHEYKSHH